MERRAKDINVDLTLSHIYNEIKERKKKNNGQRWECNGVVVNLLRESIRIYMPIERK